MENAPENILNSFELGGEKFFKEVLDQMPGITYIKDKAGVFLYVNRNFSNLFNLKKESILGKSNHDLFEKEFADIFRQSDLEVLEKKQAIVIEEKAKDFNGVVHYYQSHKFPLMDEENQVYGTGGYSFDITDIKNQKLEIELYKSQLIGSSKLASLGEMAGGIAHEINGPLAVISLSMESLKKAQRKNQLDDEMLLDIIADIESTMERVHKIVTGLRTVSRESSYTKNSATILRDIFTDVLGLCSEKFNSFGVKIDIDLDAPLFDLKILGDRVQLSQVFINLFGNAFDAIENLEEKWVKVEIAEENEFACIKVTDSGKGIPQNIREKIFNPFFTSKEIGKGTGLGLSISKNIMSQGGGSLNLDTQSANTSFVLKVPKAVLPESSPTLH